MDTTPRHIFISDCVKRFAKKHPYEYKVVCESVKKEKNKKWSKYGLIDGSSEYIRWTLRIPERLFNLIDKTLANPRFLEEKEESEWFKREFPMFMVSEKT